MRKHSEPFSWLLGAAYSLNVNQKLLFIGTLRTTPQTRNLVVFKSHAFIMEPLDGTVLIIASYHLTERNTAADAVQGLIRIDFNVEICNVCSFLLAATADFGTVVVATKLVQTLFELGVRCKLLLKAP